jgi:hypothetical protein
MIFRAMIIVLVEWNVGLDWMNVLWWIGDWMGEWLLFIHGASMLLLSMSSEHHGNRRGECEVSARRELDYGLDECTSCWVREKDGELYSVYYHWGQITKLRGRLTSTFLFAT